MAKEFKKKSRLDALADTSLPEQNKTMNKQRTNVKGTIAGQTVSLTEAEHDAQQNEKVEYMRICLTIPKDIKEQAATLAKLKQTTLSGLVAYALQCHIKRNASLLNAFSQYQIEADDIDI